MTQYTSRITSFAGRVPAALIGSLAVLMATSAFAADVTPQRLANSAAEPQNWLITFGDYSSHSYSGLDQINRDNVANLRPVFTVPVSTGLKGREFVQLENRGLVDDGYMYVDDAGGIIYKIDVRDGHKGVVLWRADSAVPRDITARSRGIAMLGNNVIAGLADGRVVSVDRDSGEFTWDSQIARVMRDDRQTDIALTAETFNTQPIAVEDRIIVSNSGGDAGSRGWVESIDAATGMSQWRFYVIPGPGHPGNETWKDTNGAWMTGGGGMWTTGSYDVGQRLLIYGTGQPQPMHDPQFRPGDNLFTNSAIALNLDDGSLKWYFQYTANENWDYDENGVHILVDAPFNGQDRQMVVHFGRNGFFYQLDRTSGEFLNAAQYVDKVTWTEGIDPKTGHPVEYDPAIDVQQYIPTTRTLRGDRGDEPSCPNRLGGVRWQPPAYNPNTHIAYSGGLDGCFTFYLEPVVALAGGGIDRAGPGGGTGIKGQVNSDMKGLITAVDVTTGQITARLPQQYYNLSGILATAGGLIFSGTLDGAITAHNDQTLEEVWRFNTGISLKAAPFSYAVDGKQYIAIMAGGNAPDTTAFPDLAWMAPNAALFVFALD